MLRINLYMDGQMEVKRLSSKRGFKFVMAPVTLRFGMINLIAPSYQFLLQSIQHSWLF